MNKQKFFTAVSKSPLLIATVLVPLLCLGWVTRLMAQSEPSDLPDFVITQPIPVDVPRADSYQIQFVGLLPDGNEGYLSVDNLSVQPLTETLGIQILTSSVRSLANDPFYVSLVIDTSGSMGLTSTTELSGTEVITQPSNLDLIKNELDSLIANAPANAFFSVVGFNGQISHDRFVAFTNTQTVLLDRIAGLQATNGSTCLNDVAVTAVRSLAQLPQNGRRAIILFTDGVDEIRRGQPESCSQDHSFQDAIIEAANITPSIPLHTVNYPYKGGEPISQIFPLTRLSYILTGLNLDENTLTDGFERILDSFTNQWLATIELYTPSGTFALELTPHRADGIPVEPQILTYSAVYEHYPAALARSITLDNLVYDEAAGEFVIDFVLCPEDLVEDTTAVAYCKPERTQAIDILIEDLFTYEAKLYALTEEQFQPSNVMQTIQVLYAVVPEHYYLVRLTARNGLTSANYHPRTEAVFAYQPQLEFTTTMAAPPRLTGFSLYPDLTVALQVTRTQATDTVPHMSVLNGRPFTNTIISQQPISVVVGGYLLYKGADSRQELYPLTPQAVRLNSTIPLTFPHAAGGGYADYGLFLMVSDRADGVGQTITTTTEIAPGLWYGRSLQQVRQILAEPLMYVVAILASLLLLGLIWFVVWLARRSVKEEEAPAPKVVRKTDPIPARLYADFSPDKKVRHQTYDLPGGRPFRIGRDHDSELPVRDDENMAKLHAQIQKMGNDFFIISCHADHATYINNQEIISNAPFRIQNGDKIRLGSHTRFTFTAPQEAQEFGHRSNGSSQK